MNHITFPFVATLLLLCDFIMCGPIQITVSDNSVYSNSEPSSGEVQKDSGENRRQEDEYLKISLLEPTDKTRESVNLEHEAIQSKIYTKYDSGHKKLADLTNPIPIIDTISESEKYGNTGDRFDGIARAVVNGYEAFSNLLNTLIGKPQQVVRSISKEITTQLDAIGAKIVGL